jgi:hypothetical protein
MPPTRAAVHATLIRTFAQPQAMAAAAGEVTLPKGLQNWLARLQLLYGVPFNYLVPDEGMLPPESIRFFYVDMNWVDAMIDGAFSIGRNLAKAPTNPSLAFDRAFLKTVQHFAVAGAPAVRAQALGVAAAQLDLAVVSGFLLRSSVVGDYKNLGVNVYAKGETPEENTSTPEKIQMRPRLRLEALGPKSSTLVCLVAGDAYQVDIHEAPDHLHYGIDDPPPAARKNMFPFTVDSGTGAVTMDTAVTVDSGTGAVTMDTAVTVDLAATNCLRTSSPRTLNMQALAKAIGQKAAPGGNPVDAAEMGFEMTVGVGKVSFRKRPWP